MWRLYGFTGDFEEKRDAVASEVGLPPQALAERDG
jgi:hypothetical protein